LTTGVLLCRQKTAVTPVVAARPSPATITDTTTAPSHQRSVRISFNMHAAAANTNVTQNYKLLQ